MKKKFDIKHVTSGFQAFIELIHPTNFCSFNQKKISFFGNDEHLNINNAQKYNLLKFVSQNFVLILETLELKANTTSCFDRFQYETSFLAVVAVTFDQHTLSECFSRFIKKYK